MIAYSTRPGSVAEDGSGRNGLYTEQLLKVIDSRKPIEQVLKQLVSSVKAASKGRQEPWSEGSLEGDFCFGGCLDENAEKNKLASDIALWESIIGSTSVSDYERYLAAYPTGTFASLAKKTLENLKIAASRPAPTQNQDSTNAVNAALQKQADENRRQELARIEREKAELLKQAEEIKKQEFARIEREKAEREKILAISEEKFNLEASNRQNTAHETYLLESNFISRNPLIGYDFAAIKNSVVKCALLFEFVINITFSCPWNLPIVDLADKLLLLLDY
jgi:uncharacterized caspase-like protein